MRSVDLRKAFWLILVTILLILLPMETIAEIALVATGGGTLNVRKEASDKSKIVTKLKNSMMIDVDEVGEVWCHVSLGEKSGYVKRQYLKLSRDAVNKTVYAEAGSLFVREEPDSQSGIVAAVSSHDGLHILEIQDEWVMIQVNGVIGYIPYEKIASQNERPVVAASPVNEQAITISEQTVYALPDIRSAELTTLPAGSYVVVSRVDDFWCLVSESGQYGYILSKYVQLTGADVVNPNLEIQNIYQYTASYYSGSVSGQTLRLYTAPTVHLDHVWKTVSMQAEETFKMLQRNYGYEGTAWARVWLKDGTVGWVLSEDVNIGDELQTYRYANPISRGASAVAYVNEGGATIYQEPSSLSADVGTIPAGAEISIHVGEAFSSISYQGLTGWVSNQQISLGFAISGKWQEEARETETNAANTDPAIYDDTAYIRPAEAQKKAAAALKKAFRSFSESTLKSEYKLTDSQFGIAGPLYYVVYSDKNEKYQYGAMVDALSGEILYTADYSAFGSADHDTPATRKPRASATPIPDFPISKSDARKIADAALSAAYGGFNQTSFSTVQCNAYSKKANYKGPLWQIDYYVGDECAYQCMVHCETGEVLYKNDIWDASLTEIDYSDPTPAPQKDTGSTIGKDRARSNADRYLANKYSFFSGCSFSNVETQFVDGEDPHFDTPYYQFDYYVDEVFTFEILIHAVTGEVEYSFGTMPGEGN